MLAYFRLIRLPNLLIIALTQYMMRWCIIRPLIKGLGFELQLSEMDFFLLVLSTVMIAAAGYIINDYFDLRVDRINKPDKIIVGRHIKRRVAMGLHVVINIIAIAIGVALALKIGIWKLSFFHLFSAISLWFYSVNFKRHLLIGNFVIAFLAALIPIIVGAYEIPLLIQTYSQELNEIMQQGDAVTNYKLYNLYFLWRWIFGYALFAFILTLAREIIKDMADYKGDKAVGCKTIPIVWGFNVAKIIVTVVTLIPVIALTSVQQTFLHDNKTLFYFIIFIQLPLLLSVYKIFTGNNRKAYLKASNYSKLAMLFGILYAILVNYIIFLLIESTTK